MFVKKESHQKDRKLGRPKASKILENLDLFKSSLPSFNLRGETELASSCGTVISMCILGIMLVYASLKMMSLTTRSNPSITTVVNEDYFDSTEVLNYAERGLRFAFTIEGYKDKK